MERLTDEVEQLELMVLGLSKKTGEIIKQQDGHISNLEGDALSHNVVYRVKDYLGLFQDGLTFDKLVEVDLFSASTELQKLIKYIESEFSDTASPSRFGRRLSPCVRCKRALANVKYTALASAHVRDGTAGSLKREDIRKDLVGDSLKAFDLLCEMIKLTGFYNAQFPFEVRSGDGNDTVDLRTYGEYPLWHHFGEHENCRACKLINEYGTANKLTGWPM